MPPLPWLSTTHLNNGGHGDSFFGQVVLLVDHALEADIAAAVAVLCAKILAKVGELLHAPAVLKIFAILHHVLQVDPAAHQPTQTIGTRAASAVG
jgi:hypothetical protein